jgi:hypothetical protein
LAESKLLKAWSAGCGGRILIAITVFTIGMAVFLGLIIFAVSLPVPANQRLSLVLGGFFLFSCLVIVGILLWGARSRRQITQVLDAVFTRCGLAGRPYLWNGRQYHGMLNGHQVDSYFYRGPSLDIYIAAPLHTRLGIGLKGWMNRIASRVKDQSLLISSDPDLAHLDIFSLDEPWGKGLLGQPQARQAILRLTGLQPGLEFRNLLFQPEAIHYQLHRLNRCSITQENVLSWLADLENLTEIAASLPLPSIRDEATAFENKARLKRSDFTIPIIGITCGILGLFTAIFILGLILLIFLQRGGI